MNKDIINEALEWWNTLTIQGKEQFPKPKDDEDIVQYYLNPSEEISLQYGII